MPPGAPEGIAPVGIAVGRAVGMFVGIAAPPRPPDGIAPVGMAVGRVPEPHWEEVDPVPVPLELEPPEQPAMRAAVATPAALIAKFEEQSSHTAAGRGGGR